MRLYGCGQSQLLEPLERVNGGNTITSRLLTSAVRSLVMLYTLRVIMNEQARRPMLLHMSIWEALKR